MRARDRGFSDVNYYKGWAVPGIHIRLFAFTSLPTQDYFSLDQSFTASLEDPHVSLAVPHSLHGVLQPHRLSLPNSPSLPLFQGVSIFHFTCTFLFGTSSGFVNCLGARIHCLPPSSMPLARRFNSAAV